MFTFKFDVNTGKEPVLLILYAVVRTLLALLLTCDFEFDLSSGFVHIENG